MDSHSDRSADRDMDNKNRNEGKQKKWQKVEKLVTEIGKEGGNCFAMILYEKDKTVDFSGPPHLFAFGQSICVPFIEAAAGCRENIVVPHGLGSLDIENSNFQNIRKITSDIVSTDVAQRTGIRKGYYGIPSLKPLWYPEDIPFASPNDNKTGKRLTREQCILVVESYKSYILKSSKKRPINEEGNEEKNHENKRRFSPEDKKQSKEKVDMEELERETPSFLNLPDKLIVFGEVVEKVDLESLRIGSWLTDKVQLSKFHYVEMPINISNTHWALMVANIPAKEVYWIDSLDNQENGAIFFRHWCTYMEKRATVTGELGDGWTQGQMKCARQTDGHSCGPFVLLNAFCLTRQMSIDRLSTKHAHAMRNFVLSNLLRCEKTPEERTHGSCDMVDCKLPGISARRARCCICSRWVHFQCAGLVDRVNDFICVICKAQYD